MNSVDFWLDYYANIEFDIFDKTEKLQTNF